MTIRFTITEDWGMADDVDGDKAKLGRLHEAADAFATHIRRHAAQLVDDGERHRAGERISTGFVESAVNQIIAKRFSKGQSMRWTRDRCASAAPDLHTRARR